MKRGFLQSKNVAKKEKQQSVTKKEEKSEENREKKCLDRISSLPKGVLYHILSFLDMKDVIRTSLLSGEWRYTWVYAPTINIDDKYWLDKKGDLKKKRFLSFVNNVLLLHDGSDIQKFHLRCPNYDTFRNRIDSWVVSVVRRNVQYLDLQFIDMQPVSSFNLSKNLKTLELKEITLSDEMERPWCGPALENLIIENCFHDFLDRLVISSPRLKYLMLKSEMYCEKAGPQSCEIKICAPNLKFLQCIRMMYKGYCLENLSSLEAARIDTDVAFKEGNHEELKGVLGTCLNNILKGLSNAKSLTLDIEGIQAFAELPGMLKSVSNFPNLKYLKVMEWSTGGHIHSLAKLFERFSCIETLVLQRVEEMYGPTRIGDWDKQQLDPSRVFQKLKYVQLENLRGSVNEFDFIKYLLKTASALENFKAIPAKDLSRNKKFLLKKFYENIQSLPKASSAVVLSLLEPQP
ncbi:hypothetical protein ACHQM5_017408 [Ranunculus cassubicifolius]